MNNISKKIENIENLFLISLFVSLFSNEISIIPTAITSKLNLLFLGIGTLLLIYCLICKDERSLFKLKDWKEIALLILVLSLSVIFNLKSGLTPIKKIYFIVIQLLVFYPIMTRRINDNPKYLYKIFKIFIFFTLFIATIGLVLWFMRISGLFFINDRIRSIGIRYVLSGDSVAYWLLYGIYRDSNYAATLSGLSIMFSVLTLKNKDEMKLKNILIANIIVQFVFFTLNNSRSNTYIAMIAIALFVFMSLNHKYHIRIVYSLLAGLFLFGAVTGVRNLLGNFLTVENTNFITYEYKWREPTAENVRDDIKLNHWIKLQNLAGQEGVEEIPTPNTKEDVGSGGNGRIDIFKESLILSKDRLLLGYGTDNVQNYAIEKFNSEGRLAKGYVIDNSYLQILVSYGIIGTIAFAIFHLKRFINGVKNKNILIVPYLFIMMLSMFYAEYIIGNNIIVILLITLLLSFDKTKEFNSSSIKNEHS